MALKRMVLLMAMAITAFFCYAQQTDKPDDRDSRCHVPYHGPNCNTLTHHFGGSHMNISGWFYHPTLKACRPTFSPNGTHDCVENFNLPKTRDECENICSHSCVMFNGETGVCMYDMHCRVHFKRGYETKNLKSTCANSVNCCPKLPDSNLTLTSLMDHTSHLFVKRVVINSTGTFYSYIIPGHKFMNRN